MREPRRVGVSLISETLLLLDHSAFLKELYELLGVIHNGRYVLCLNGLALSTRVRNVTVAEASDFIIVKLKAVERKMLIQVA